jgi:hypothetical protein
MKLPMRVCIAVFLAVCVMTWTGSAWADANSVESAITTLGLARKSGETGNTITVVNNSSDPLVKDATGNSDGYLLNLGDTSGLTIDWKANLTVTGEAPNYQD